MAEQLVNSADQYRFGIFVAILILMAVLEFFLPRRSVKANRSLRWTSNLGIVILDSIVVRVLIPTTTIAVALYAEASSYGLFNLISVPFLLTCIASIVLLDLFIYGQHVVFHKIKWLWRFHRMHHSDTHIDVTTGIRFHPVEIVLSLLIKFAVIIIFGIPAVAIVIFEIILNATAMITHSNLYLPGRLDKWLRWLVVTPDMHRIHHSIHRHETDSNYGFNLSIWDRLFRTYSETPEDSHEKMKIGIEIFREPREQVLDKMLTQPFRGNSDTANHTPR